MAKRILITGASGGIGEACALNLAQKGYGLALNGRNEAKLNDVAKRCLDAGAAEVQILKFDVADTATAQERIEADIEANGAYWGIVLNAGITRDNSFVWFEREDWQSVIDTNLGGFYNVLKPALMPMIRTKKGGRIVVMSSVSGIAGNRGQSNYAASKGGLIAAAKSLAIELASRKITVNVVAPGLIKTAMSEGINETASEQILSAIPLGRIGEPSEVAHLVEFLLSENSAYITKEVIKIDGGLC